MKISHIQMTFLALALGALAAGCSSSSDDFSYNYELCSNCKDSAGNCYADNASCGGGCTTGKHEAKSKDEACQMLNSRDGNNACQPATREGMFKNLECGGNFAG